jgi:Ca2+-transporting ATPase
MVYMGTVAANGRASAVVTVTGMNTELGKIAGLLQAYEPESTPLQRRLAQLGKLLIGACLIIVFIIFLLHIARGEKLIEAILFSVSLAVAAVPEGLPAVVTVTLAIGLQRMVKRNALIRKLPSVETLGSVTVICSDKTGTLTRNEMTVREIAVRSETYQVTGAGYLPYGEFIPQKNGNEAPPIQEHYLPPELNQTLTIGAWCNNASAAPDGDGSKSWKIMGDPTEAALVVAALKAKIEVDKKEKKILYEIPFDSERKAMSVAIRNHQGECFLYTKGAPEVILKKSTHEFSNGTIAKLDDDRRKQISDKNREMASRALRVLAVGYRPMTSEKLDSSSEKDLIFVGLVGMMDPPREEVKLAVKKCHRAGIRPVMITGDHPDTALAIARELHIAGPLDRVLTGHDLDQIREDELRSQVEQIAVFARVSAEHKLRIVKALKHRGHIVAMTGDGVNDAPAVKVADIGIAMGITGSDVTKEASDMVLTDDNFASIVNAVEEGRGIFANIQKFLHYLLSSNASEIIFIFLVALIGWPMPLLAIQILWINLVSDSFPALALGMEKVEPHLMHQRPRPPNKPVLSLRDGLRIFLHGLLIASATLIGFAWVYMQNEARLDHARSIAFCILSYAQIFYSLSCRSHYRTFFGLGVFSNFPLFIAISIASLLQLSVTTLSFARSAFAVEEHLFWDWILIFGLSLAPVTLIEVTKLLKSLWKRIHNP